MTEACEQDQHAQPGGQSRWMRIAPAWMRRYSADFWKFFAAAFFFDFGFGLFLFLFNLYLTDLHFNERVIGQILASMTLGNVVGTIPAMILVRRRGFRRPLLISFLGGPLICGLRVVSLWTPAQIGLAFLTGLALCFWPICFSPAVAKYTNEQNRASGFSIVFATGIGMGSLAGLAGGYLPRLLQTSSAGTSPVAGIRVVLLCACGAVMLGAWPLANLTRDAKPASVTHGLRMFHPFLKRFLPPFILWNVVTGSFTIFGAVYLQQTLGLSLSRVGVVFSVSQLLQFAAVLSTPLLYRRLGTLKGVSLAQMMTAALLLLLAASRTVPLSVASFLAFNGAQWMCGPGIYRYLMEHIPEEERSTASAVQNLSGALCQAGTAALTGSCIVQFGYTAVIAGNAVIALLAALLFLSLPQHREPMPRSRLWARHRLEPRTDRADLSRE
ncbi:MAG: MFS transporter [Terracidiphilus sp.]